MGLRLITGCAKTGKSAALREQLYASTSRLQHSALLVPSAPDVSRALHQISGAMPLGVSVATLDGFLDGLWARHGDGRSIVTPVQRLAVLEESVRFWQPENVESKHSSPGMLSLLGSLAERWAESASPIKARELPRGPARDLGSAVEEYLRLLARAGLVERGEAHRAVADLTEIELPALIALDGFTGLTVAQESFIIRAASRVDVALTLTYDPGLPATQAAGQLVERLGVLGEHLHLRPAQETSELSRLAIAFTAPSRPPLVTEGAVRLSEARGRAAEVGRITREVQEAQADGYAPEHIVIAFRDSGSYLHEMRRALVEAHIPAAFDARVPFSGTPLGRTLLALLQVDSLSHNQLVDLLRSPYSPAPRELLDAFDAYVRTTRRNGIDRAIRWFESKDPSTAAFLRKARRAHAASGEDNHRRWYGIASELLARAGDGITGSSDDAATARVFMEAIAGLYGSGRQAVRSATLVEILSQASVVISEDGGPGVIRVLGAERARGAECRCLILGGLNAGEFPRNLREDALSEPSTRVAFGRRGVELDPRSGVDEERLLFYQVITRPTERLVLSWQTNGDNGEVRRASIFLEEVLDLYRDPLTKLYFGDELPVSTLGPDRVAEDPAAPRTERRTLRAVILDGAPVESEREREAVRRAVSAPISRSVQAAALAAGRGAVSASEIEAYLQCPYRWSLEWLVRPRELDERMDQRAAGRLGHDIMRRFYELFCERSGDGRVTPGQMDAARGAHADAVSECMSLLGELSVLDEIACRTVARRTWHLVEEDATLLPGFSPIAHEWAFGMGDDDPEPLVGFSLRGRIDRIDSDGERLVLFDYKSGTIGAEHGANRSAAEGLVQLSLYAAVAERRLGLPVAAAVYRSFKGGKPRGFVLQEISSSTFVSTDAVTAEEAAASVSAAIAESADAVMRMREGAIPAEARGGKCPKYCSARPYCAGWRPSRG